MPMLSTPRGRAILNGPLQGASSPGPAPTGGPVLSITSPATNSTPTFSVLFDDLVPAGAVLTLQHDTNPSFTSPTTIAHTITSGEGGASTVPLGLSALPNGLRYFRLKVTIDGTASAWSNTASQTIAAASILSAPSATPGATSGGFAAATFNVTTNNAGGTLYWVATTSATPPTANQVQTGKDATGAAASAAGSQAVSAIGMQTINTSTLPMGTTLYAHFMHLNSVPLQSGIADSAAFLTATTNPVLAYVSNPAPSGMSGSGAGPWTSSSISIGPAFTGRRLIVVVDGGSGNPTVASGGITIGGVRTPFTNIVNGGYFAVNFMTCLAPSGTAGVVDVTFTGGNFATPRVQVFTVDDAKLTSLTPVIAANDISAVSTISTSVIAPAGAIVMAALSFGSGAGKAPIAISAPFGIDVSNDSSVFLAHRDGVSAGSVSATTTWTGNFDASLVLAAYR